jgi:hypothetical protein
MWCLLDCRRLTAPTDGKWRAMLTLSTAPQNTSLTWHYMFGVQKVWIDVVIFVVFAAIHTAANARSPGLSKESGARDQAFSFVKELASSSVTVVGILLPLSLAAVGTLATKHVHFRVLANIFIGDTWLALSLSLGLLVLWASGFRAPTQNVQNLAGIRFLNGWQLAAIMAGIVRLLIATFFLVQAPN